MKKLLFFRSELKATFWFVPVLIILPAIMLAVGFIYADGVFPFSQEGCYQPYQDDTSFGQRNN
jgi:hypothetical protein